MRTLQDLGDLAGKRVLVRVDFNVPLDHGAVADDTRIQAALPAIDELRRRGARLVLVSHLGRPKDHEPELSLRPVANRLAELAASLAALADVYVNDASGGAHRAHASTEGVAHLVAERAAGRLLEREVSELSKVLDDPARPLIAVLGGAKVSDKIAVIERFLQLADALLIGGAMCFPFLAAQGHSIGASLCASDDVELAKRALEAAQTARAELQLPVDLVVADRFAADAGVRAIDSVDVPAGWMGLDIGGRTSDRYAAVIERAGTVFWNGPMGAFELPPFAAGTRVMAEAVAAASGTTVVGGGDSVSALRSFGLIDKITHVSTGGGASLELIEGKKLPGIEVLDETESREPAVVAEALG